MTAPHLKLKTWEEFKGDMAQYTTQFDEALREHVLVGLYNRAAQLRDLENLRLEEKGKVPSLRSRRARARQLRKLLQGAIRSLEKARACDALEFLDLDLLQAKGSLERAVHDLTSLEDFCLASIHPALRRNSEKSKRAHSSPPEHWSLFPGFGKSKIDWMFIRWMENYLKGLWRRDGTRLPSAEIDRIITATLKAALEQYCTEDRVKTARRRLPHP